MSISDRIKKLRKEHNLSQTALGAKLFPDATESSSQAKLTRIETGKQSPTLQEIYEIADFFNVSSRWLIDGEDNVSFGEEYVRIPKYKARLFYLFYVNIVLTIRQHLHIITPNKPTN